MGFDSAPCKSLPVSLVLLLLFSRADGSDVGLSQLHVIGAGMPRTGTTSLRAALHKLGFRAFHMQDIMASSRHSRAWLDFVTDQSSFDDLIEHILRSEFNATVDAPFNHFVDQLVQRFPLAKVILTVRDSKDWAQSMAKFNFFMEATRQRPFNWVEPFRSLELLAQRLPRKIKMKPRVIRHVWEFEDEYLARVQADWVQQVEEVVPFEKLLVFNVSDGWGPLCKFLDMPVPPGEFPNLNQGTKVQVWGYLLHFVCWTWPAYPVLLFRHAVKCMCRSCPRKGHKQS
eukprot:s6425_g4.t1